VRKIGPSGYCRNYYSVLQGLDAVESALQRYAVKDYIPAGQRVHTTDFQLQERKAFVADLMYDVQKALILDRQRTWCYQEKPPILGPTLSIEVRRMNRGFRRVRPNDYALHIISGKDDRDGEALLANALGIERLLERVELRIDFAEKIGEREREELLDRAERVHSAFPFHAKALRIAVDKILPSPAIPAGAGERDDHSSRVVLSIANHGVPHHGVNYIFGAAEREAATLLAQGLMYLLQIPEQT